MWLGEWEIGTEESASISSRWCYYMRPQRPWGFTNLKTGQGLQALIDFIVERGILQAGKGHPVL
jgi:urease accessory protein